MVPMLNSVERRVLGVLMEKALSLPQYYPMTLNAIVTGCNQKQNRDPLMDLDEEAVWSALETLRSKDLVIRLPAGANSRADKFKHKAAESLGWQAQQRAIMTELLLRGPQTIGELRTRCGRMSEFESTDLVTSVLEVLGDGATPAVKSLPRQPGQSAIRWTHLLYPPDEARAAESHSAAMQDHSSTMAPAGAFPLQSVGSSVSAAEVENLREEFSELRRQVTELREAFDQLRRSLGA